MSDHAPTCPAVRDDWPAWLERWCDCGAVNEDDDEDG